MYEQVSVTSESAHGVGKFAEQGHDLHQKTEAKIAKLKEWHKEIMTMETADDMVRQRWLDQLNQLIASGENLLDQRDIDPSDGEWRRWMTLVVKWEEQMKQTQEAFFTEDRKE